MKLRIFFTFILVVALNSCKFFTADTTKNEQELDTIIDYSSVDTPPTFKVCDSLIDKSKQTDCFRITFQQKIMEQLATFSLEVKNPMDEIVTLTILINTQGHFKFQNLKASELIKAELPKLDSILRVSVANLPKVQPAIKRGIRVSTQYELPILIKLQE